MKPQTRSAVCVVRSADLVQRNTKEGPKNQLEVVTDDGKLQTWNAGLWSAVEPLIGCYASVEYRDKARPYPGEWLLDRIRPATDSEADAYIAGETPSLRELGVEQAIAVAPTLGSDSTRTESARRATTPVRAQDGGWSASGLESPAAGAAAAQGGIRDAQIHAQTACTVAAQLVGDFYALDALAYVKTVKALTKVFSEGASDESLADLAEVLGADNLAALAVLNQMDSLASGGEEPTPAEASPSSNGNGPRIAETHVTQFSGKVKGRWVPTKAEREKLLAAGWSEEDLTVTAISSGRGPLDPDDVPFIGATAKGGTS
jgi:hypothetical protein